MLKQGAQMVIDKFQGQVPIGKRLAWSGLPTSSFYYQTSSGSPGRKPSETTLKTNGTKVDNCLVVDEIKLILGVEFLCYGYVPVTDELFDRGYLINHKKVYRIMRENHLLCGKVIATHTGKRQFIRFRKINAQYPMQHMCMDIKYIYIKGERKFTYLLSLIDIYSRKIMGYVLKPSIKQHDVIWLLSGVIGTDQTTSITIRNDNGSQFIAKSVRKYLEEIKVNQEFSHIATPEDNSYIEAFHSILERELTSRYEFDSTFHAEMKIAQYMFTYNNIRKHGSIGLKTPHQAWNEYFSSPPTDSHRTAPEPVDLSRLADSKNKNSIPKSAMHFNLEKSIGSAIFGYLLASESIRNFISKNLST
jgi:transposase InsO family protein